MNTRARKSVVAAGFSLFLGFAVVGCSDDASGDATAPGEGSNTVASVGGADVPDACTFFTTDEIETALGTTIEDGEPKQAPENTSTCRFGGIANVTINTYATSDSDFTEFYEINGNDATKVGDLGDDAFLIGDVLLHVRVDDLAFSIRINDEQNQVDDLDQARLTLAQAGVAKLH